MSELADFIKILSGAVTAIAMCIVIVMLASVIDWAHLSFRVFVVH